MQQPAVAGNWFADRQSLALMLGGALLAMLLTASFLCNDSPDRASIVRMKGVVEIERGGQMIIPNAGMMLNVQDKILTGSGAFIEIAYDDAFKDILRIGPDSRVVFESARIQKQTTLFMDRGEIKLKLDSLEKGSTFKVRTPVAIAGVRGTAFGVELKGKDVLITDYESRIFVKGLTTDFMEMSDELLLNNGWKVRVAQFEKPSRVARMSSEEYAAWKSWLNAVDALPRSASINRIPLIGLTHTQQAFLQQPANFVTTMTAKASSSAPTLALILFAVLTLGTGKVLERVWS